MKRYLPLLFILLMASSELKAQENDKPLRLRILSLNILHGATTQGDFDLDAIAEFIKKTDPDLVALQEVDYKTERAKGYDLVTELGWRTKMAPIFGKAMEFDGGEYGEAVLSKSSFTSSRNIPLPYGEDKEPRAALEVRTAPNLKDTIAFIGTHLDHTRDDRSRQMQVEKINEVFSKNVIPSILAGDLNDVPDSKVIQTLEKVWWPSYKANQKIEPTIPSHDPRAKIDYIMFYPKSKWKVIETEVLCDSIVSDHCGYLVIAELKND